MPILDAFKSAMGSLFGKGQTPKDRQKAVSLDLITSDLENIPDGALAALWEQLDGRNPHTPMLIREARRAMNGESRPKMAPEWDIQDREDYHPGAPDAFNRPRETAARLSSKEARVSRPVSSFGPTEQQNSTKIEQFANAVLDEQFADYETVEMLLNESMACWIAVPAPAHWRQMETAYDEDESEGEYATQDEYDSLTESRKRQYEPANPRAAKDGAEPRYKRLRKSYRINSKGETDDGSDTFEVDYKRVKKKLEDNLEDYRARKCPILLRGPISRLDFIPLNPSFSGKRTIFDGVLIRQLYRQSKLAREYAWEGCDQLLEPVDNLDGQDGDFWLYELWAYGPEGCPFVAYQVGKRGAYFADDGSTAVIKLDEAFPGITELPVAVEYGQHTADPDPDKRGLPFAIPYLDNWRRREDILTAMCISIASSGYPTWVQVLTPESIEVMNAIEGDVDLEFRMRPNTVQYAIGQLQDVSAKGQFGGVEIVFKALDALNERELPSKGAFGGEGPSSGLDRQIQGKDFDVSFRTTIEGDRRLKESMGRYTLMIASALGKAADQPVELYSIGTAPNPQTGATTTKRTRLTLPPDLCDGNWDLVAEFETVPGERLAQSSLFLEALAQGAILLREWREWGVGDTNSEQFIAEKLLEDFYLKDPAGRLAVYRGMLDYVADTKMKQMLELAHQGDVTSAQGGVSTAAMDHLLGGAGQPQGQIGPGGTTNTGIQYGNPAQSQLAGAVGGAVQASAGAAGSPFDPTMAA